MSKDFAADFLDRYRRSFDYYKAAAELCAGRCSSLLLKAGIKVIVTSRPKDVQRLHAKLKSRHREYSSLTDVELDIVDLAGVRIALYYPGDMETVLSVISECVDEISIKRFPEDSKSSTGRRFAGYRAIHLRCKLKPDTIADDRYAAAQIEIQIASLFMHAWAEVDHDLVYKPIEGPPSAEEIETIDELNGLTLASEIALERLQRLTVSRRAKENAAFSNVYAMSSYIHDFLAAKHHKAVRLYNADGLFEYLRFKNMHKPSTLQAVLEQAQIDPESSVIAQVGNSIAYGNLDEYRELSNAKNRAYGYPAMPDENSKHSFEQTQLDFIRRWVSIQALVELKLCRRPRTFRDWELAATELAASGWISDELAPSMKELAAAFHRCFYGHVGFSMDLSLVSRCIPMLATLQEALST